MALTRWMQHVENHGYGRMLIERGSGDNRPEDGSYVLLYAGGSEWARWGLARNGAEIVVWQCSDGSDIGRFATMGQALDRLPTVWTRRLGRRPKPTRRVPRYLALQPG